MLSVSIPTTHNQVSIEFTKLIYIITHWTVRMTLNTFIIMHIYNYPSFRSKVQTSIQNPNRNVRRFYDNLIDHPVVICFCRKNVFADKTEK